MSPPAISHGKLKNEMSFIRCMICMMCFVLDVLRNSYHTIEKSLSYIKYKIILGQKTIQSKQETYKLSDYISISHDLT